MTRVNDEILPLGAVRAELDRRVALLEQGQGVDRILLTDHGRPVAVIISIDR